MCAAPDQPLLQTGCAARYCSILSRVQNNRHAKAYTVLCLAASACWPCRPFERTRFMAVRACSPGSQLACSRALITTALQRAVLAGSNPAMDAVGGTSSLRMQSCSIPYLVTPALIDALTAVSSLRYLSLSCALSQPTAAVCAALGRLRNIQDLHLENAEERDGVVTTELAVAVQQLQQLTSLSVDHDMHADLLRHLPTGLQDLSLSSITAAPDAEFVPAHELPAAEPALYSVHFQHLTRLTSLCLETSVPLSEDSLLPQELIQLTAHGPCNFHPSSKLERLQVNAPQDSLGLMQFLPNLPQLRDLSVEMSAYNGDAEIAAVVAAVQHTMQVTALDWGFGSLFPWADVDSAAENAVMAILTQPIGYPIR